MSARGHLLDSEQNKYHRSESQVRFIASPEAPVMEIEIVRDC